MAVLMDAPSEATRPQKKVYPVWMYADRSEGESVHCHESVCVRVCVKDDKMGKRLESHPDCEWISV